MFLQHEGTKPVAAKPSPRTAHRMLGFSLLEMVTVVAIALIASSVFFISLMPALKNIRATNAFNSVLASLRQAHDRSVAERGVLLVTFTSPGTVTISQPNTTVCQGGGGSVGSWFTTRTVTLPTDMQFQVDSNLPTAAPDSFGTGKVAIDFDQGVGGGGGTTIYFCPDGSARDATNNINNGIVYMERTSDLYSSRAITVWGLSGRIRGWQLDKSSSGTYWRRM